MSAVDDIAAYLAHLKTGGNRIDQIIFDELPNGEEMTATDELRRLLDESAKLRELVRDMAVVICVYDQCVDDCPPALPMFTDKMRELGIEVNDG